MKGTSAYVGVDVGVQLLCFAPEGCLELIVSRARVNAQQLVIVWLLGRGREALRARRRRATVEMLRGPRGAGAGGKGARAVRWWRYGTTAAGAKRRHGCVSNIIMLV